MIYFNTWAVNGQALNCYAVTLQGVVKCVRRTKSGDYLYRDSKGRFRTLKAEAVITEVQTNRNYHALTFTRA